MDSEGDATRFIAARARDRCEYCGMHQSLQGATFHVEHIIPISRNGSSTSDNVAWARPGCNLRKSDRVHVPDPMSDTLVPLFNPRKQEWGEHFRWHGTRLIGKTPTGRATVAALDFNHLRRLRIRRAEEAFGLFPP